MTEPHRKHLLHIFRSALAAVNGRQRVREALHRKMPTGPVALLAVGKAAASMAQGAVEMLGSRLQRSLVVTKYGYAQGLAPTPDTLQCIEAGHPLPDEQSLKAGRALLSFLDEVPRDTTLLVLLSGGTSALVEVLPDGVNLTDLRRVNEWLLASGLDIGAMNQVRCSLSCIKGGRLAARLEGLRCRCLLISDVPDNDVRIIGSGLLASAPPPRPVAVPAWLGRLMSLTPPQPVANDPCFDGIEYEIVATLAEACTAAAAAGRALGYAVFAHAAPLTGDAEAWGRVLARRLCEGPAGLHIWGGETSVSLPAAPGRGGRNQHLALAAAQGLAGRAGVWLLAAGSDGSDGPGRDAGALVDGGTLERGADSGLSAVEALAKADSGRFLHASGDQVRTGPTGTNVMDLVLGLKTT